MDKTLILNEIKSYLKIEKNTDFANFLEIKPTTLAMWYKRNTFDIELLFKKCENIDANWLLTGKGEMLKSVPQKTPMQEVLSITSSQVSQVEILLKEKIALLEENKALLQEKVAKLEADIQALKSI